MASKTSHKSGGLIKRFFSQYNLGDWAMITVGALLILTSLFLVFTKTSLNKYLIKYEYREDRTTFLKFYCTTEWQELNDNYRECVEKNETDKPRGWFPDFPSEVGKYCETKFPKYEFVKDEQEGSGYLVNQVKKILFIPVSTTPHHYRVISPPLYAEEFLIDDEVEFDLYQKRISESKKYNHKSCTLKI